MKRATKSVWGVGKGSMDSINQTKHESMLTSQASRIVRKLRPLKALLPMAAVVAGGFLLYALTAMGPLALLGQAFAGTAAFLGQGLVVPLWLVVTLMLTSLFSLSVTAWRVSAAFVAARRAGNPYTSDRILEIDWQWRWRDHDPEAASLTPLCPSCAYELSMQAAQGTSSSVSFDGGEVSLVCESCAFNQRFDVGPNELLIRVIKEIRRRSRTQAPRWDVPSPHDEVRL